MLTVAFTVAASLQEFWPFCLVLSLPGSDIYLTFVPQLGALSESLTHSIPRSFLVVSLSAYAVGFADALWLCPECASAFSLRLPRWSIPSHCRPSHAVSWLTVSVICERLLLRRGVSPWVGLRRSPWGLAVAPPLSPYTGPV